MPGAEIPDDWDGTSWKCWTVEWPDSVKWLALLNGFITTPRLGRFWDGATGSIIAAQAVGTEIWYRNTPELEETLMSCNEDFLELMSAQNIVLGQMAQYLAQLADCSCSSRPTTGGTGGSRGAGTTGQAPSTYNQGETPETPPPGFSDMAEYRTHKCNAAFGIIDELGRDLQSMTLVSLIGTTATALAGVLAFTFITPVPFDDLLAIAITVIVGAVQASWLAEVSFLLNGNIDDLTCEIYNAPDAETAKTALVSAIEALIDASPDIPTIGKPYVKEIVEAMVTYDSINRAFTATPMPYAHDCSSCGPDYWWTCSIGEVLEYTVDTVELGAVEDGGGGYTVVIGKDIADDWVTSLQNGSITPHPTAAQCATTIYDTVAECYTRSCYETFVAQYPTGVFGAINGATCIMYRSGVPFSVLFELA